MKKIMMTRLSVCSLGVSCNEMIDTPMLLVVGTTYNHVLQILQVTISLNIIHIQYVAQSSPISMTL